MWGGMPLSSSGSPGCLWHGLDVASRGGPLCAFKYQAKLAKVRSKVLAGRISTCHIMELVENSQTSEFSVVRLCSPNDPSSIPQTHSRRRELTPAGCPLISHEYNSVHTVTRTHITHTASINKKKLRKEQRTHRKAEGSMVAMAFSTGFGSIVLTRSPPCHHPALGLNISSSCPIYAL